MVQYIKKLAPKCPKLRVLHIGSPSSMFGAERWIMALINHLDQDKVESWISVIKDEVHLTAPLCAEASKIGFRTHIFEAYGKSSFGAIQQIRSFIKKNQIDILHTHYYKPDLIGLIATLNTECKIISTPHGWCAQNDFKLRCYETINRYLFPFFDAVVPVSQDMRSGLETIPCLKKKLYPIDNAVDISELNAVNHVTDELSQWKQEGYFVVGYIGRLVPEKGLDTLLIALSYLKAFEWRLAIIGAGEYRAELEAMTCKLGISEQVVFFGFRVDRIFFLKGFDLFVLPSHLEGIPRCLMEAMALGIPSVVSDIPGCRHLVTHEQTGLLFPVRDAQELSHAIERIWKNPELRERFSLQGVDLVRKKFSADRMAKEYEQLYHSL